MKRFIRRPSPAMVVACIALFVALGGVSYGVATGYIDSREIKNNTIRGKDVKNGALTGKEFKRDSVGGLSVNEGSLGNVPSAESLSHSAVVTAGGTFRRGRGVSSVARAGTGRYQVIFNRDVRGCVYNATVGDPSAAAPGHGTAVVGSVATIVNAVAVRTFNQQANLADRSFHLIVSC
jgi:hypothetical protein